MNLFENLQLMKESKEVYLKDNNKFYIVMDKQSNKEIFRALKNGGAKGSTIDDLLKSMNLKLVKENIFKTLHENENTAYDAELFCFPLNEYEENQDTKKYKRYGTIASFYSNNDDDSSVILTNTNLEKLLKSMMNVYNGGARMDTPYEMGIFKSDIDNWKDLYIKEGHSEEDFEKLILKYFAFSSYDNFYNECE